MILLIQFDGSASNMLFISQSEGRRHEQNRESYRLNRDLLQLRAEEVDLFNAGMKIRHANAGINLTGKHVIRSRAGHDYSTILRQFTNQLKCDDDEKVAFALDYA